MKTSEVEELEEPTPLPSGKQRQKKSGRGRPTPSLIASVITPVTSTEYRRPEYTSQSVKFTHIDQLNAKQRCYTCKISKGYLIWHGADHRHPF